MSPRSSRVGALPGCLRVPHSVNLSQIPGGACGCKSFLPETFHILCLCPFLPREKVGGVTTSLLSMRKVMPREAS